MDRQHTILCVDDEPNILKALERALTPRGYKILSALNGPAGLQVLETEQVDLVIVDQRMPKMTGTEFICTVKDKYPGMRRIMLSGYSDFNELLMAINEGEIFRFLAKPWDNRELFKIIREALEQKRLVDYVEEVIKDIKQISEFSNNITVETLRDREGLVVKLKEQGRIVSAEAVFDFLDFIFKTFGLENELSVKISSGIIKKQKGVVTCSVDIGDGMNLRIELPPVDDK